MTRIKWAILVISILTFSGHVFSQDEGAITKKGWVLKEKSVYLSGGPAFRFGNNSSDYSGGLNLEGGYLKRINRSLSIGPALSYTKFNYDETISDSFGDEEAEGNNVFYDDPNYEARVVYIEGGDLSLIALGFNVKANFIPLSETKQFSFYGIAKPFVLLSKRTEITASVEHWFYNTIPPDDPENWTFSGPPEFLSSEEQASWAADTEFSGGINLGVGAEFVLPSGVSFFLQGAINLTLPITHINTSEFPNTYDGFYDPDYPLVKKGFSSLNVSIGVAYSF